MEYRVLEDFSLAPSEERRKKLDAFWEFASAYSNMMFHLINADYYYPLPCEKITPNIFPNAKIDPNAFK